MAVSLILSAVLLFRLDVGASNAPIKKIALLGDSMTWIGGDSCENATGWSHILKSSGIAESIDVFARSGATWTNTKGSYPDTAFYSEILHDNNVVYNQALRLIERSEESIDYHPDYIIIFAGANDAWFSGRRPGIFDKIDSSENSVYSTDTAPGRVTTLFGSVALVCDILNVKFPDSSIVIVTPLQMSKVSAETIYMVSDIIQDAARSRDCLVLRGDKEIGLSHEIESKNPKFTYDGVHTNPEGALLVGNYIINSLQDIHNKSKN